MNSKFIKEELENTLQTMKLGKTPGLDDLPLEFYRVFKMELLPYLEQLMDYCNKEGVIPPSWREARLVLIFKEGKYQSIPISYRPLSMLNVDYKILATTLANRLSSMADLCKVKIKQGLFGIDV